MKPIEEKILKRLWLGGPKSQNELLHELKIPYRTLARALKDLEKQGMVVNAREERRPDQRSLYKSVNENLPNQIKMEFKADVDVFLKAIEELTLEGSFGVPEKSKAHRLFVETGTFPVEYFQYLVDAYGR